MISNRRAFVFFSFLAAAIACLVLPASARTESITHGGEYYWRNVIVPADQEIDGNVTVYGGDVVVEGKVDGDVSDYGGTISTRDDGTITGATREYGDWSGWMPFAPNTAFAHENAKLVTRLAYSIIVVLAFLIFPIRVRKALDRIEHHPGLSAATGLLSIVAIVPVAIILLISVVGWPLIPVEFIAIFAGILIGQAALGILLGRRIYELLHPHTTPSPLMALVIGLVVLSAAEILPAVGGLVTGLVCLVGLGAAVLAFVRESTFGGPGAPAAGIPPRPTISGPPMTQV